MAKLKYYALCSSNISATKRHATRIPTGDLVIVLNSTNWEYVEQAEAWCQAEGIDYHVTESDGTPATGKNSVFDLFLASDNDYMVLVDGDDFITPHGLVVYDMLAQSASPPDAVALTQQFGLVPNDGGTRRVFFFHGGFGEGSSRLFAADKDNPDHVHGSACRPFMNSPDWWSNAVAGTSVEYWDEFTEALSNAHQKLYTYAYNHLNETESHLRVTFYSRNAVTYRFDSELLVGEDTHQYYELKNAWAAGDIELRHMDELYPTYVYDQRVMGVVKWANEQDSGRGWLNWMTALNAKLDAMSAAGKLHTTQPPTLELTFADDYRPDVMGMVNYPARRTKY